MDNDSKRAKAGDRGRWCEAEIVGRANPPTERSRTRALWKVHFRGWDSKFDEFIFAEHAERFKDLGRVLVGLLHQGAGARSSVGQNFVTDTSAAPYCTGLALP